MHPRPFQPNRTPANRGQEQLTPMGPLLCCDWVALGGINDDWAEVDTQEIAERAAAAALLGLASRQPGIEAQPDTPHQTLLAASTSSGGGVSPSGRSAAEDGEAVDTPPQRTTLPRGRVRWRHPNRLRRPPIAPNASLLRHYAEICAFMGVPLE